MRTIHARACDKYGIDMNTARYELPAEDFIYEWRGYVLREFERGSTMTPSVWRSLDDWTQHRIMRTRRAMRDDELRRTLEDM